MFTGPEDKFVIKNIGVQCSKVYLKKSWPNFDSNLRCLKLINLAITRTKKMLLSLSGINKYSLTIGVLFQCIRAILL